MAEHCFFFSEMVFWLVLVGSCRLHYDMCRYLGKSLLLYAVRPRKPVLRVCSCNACALLPPAIRST